MYMCIYIYIEREREIQRCLSGKGWTPWQPMFMKDWGKGWGKGKGPQKNKEAPTKNNYVIEKGKGKGPQKNKETPTKNN